MTQTDGYFPNVFVNGKMQVHTKEPNARMSSRTCIRRCCWLALTGASVTVRGTNMEVDGVVVGWNGCGCVETGAVELKRGWLAENGCD